MRHAILVWAVLGLALFACAPQAGTARGVVLSVEGNLTEVDSFTVLVEGDEMTFVPFDDGDYAFPLAHLREHQRTGEPVLVGWERTDNGLIALSVKDG